MNQLADAVKTTIGPKGRNVMVAGFGDRVFVTNEGSAVVKDFELADITENLGAQMLKQVAEKTNEAVGDGTSTAMLLTQAIIRGGTRNMAAGVNPMGLRRGIQGAVNAAVQSIGESAYLPKGKEDIVQVASISGADRQTGEILGEIMDQVGQDGVITIEDSQTMDTSFEIVKGSQFDKGYLSEYMVTDTEKMEAMLEHPYILFTDKKISSLGDIIPILDKVAQCGRKLLIVAEDVEGEALKALVINKLQGAIDSVAVRAPGVGERKKALVDEFTVRKDRTIIVGGAGDKAAIAEEIEKLRRMLAEAKDEFAVDRARERLGKLAGGVAVIRVGAASELELKEKKARVEDALNAVRAALAEGIVAGGGVAFCNAIPAVRKYAQQLTGDELSGAQVVMEALEEPMRQIAQNAGFDSGVVASEAVKQGNGVGLDVITGEFVRMAEVGIVDPAKVTKLALKNAASMASVFLTTEVDVIDPIDEAWLRSGGKTREESNKKVY